MIINFTDKHQFHTRLQLKGQTIEIVPKMKILGTVVTDRLSWDENCAILVKKVNAWMQLLKTVWSFGFSKEELVHLWKIFCRSILEQTCVLWDSGLTEQNRTDLERTQKTFTKLVLQEEYTDYKSALLTLQLETLEIRQKTLSLNFAMFSLADGLLRDLFPLRRKAHLMKTRSKDKYKITHANTERFKNSHVLTKQSMLNREELTK